MLQIRLSEHCRLPKVLQDNAADLVAEYVMSASNATLTDSMTRSSDLTSAMKPINPDNVIKRRDSRDNNNKDPVDDSENLNPEEVHKSLRSTANAIQNYSFEAKSDELPSLSDKMSLLDIGLNRNGSSSGSNGENRSNHVTKINIERTDQNVSKAGKTIVKILFNSLDSFRKLFEF